MDYIFYLLILIDFIYIIYLSKKALHMLQQNLYNENNRYLKWISKNKNTFFNLSLYGVLFALMLFFSKTETTDIFFLTVLILVYISSFVVEKEKRKSDQNKKPLVITKRVKRLIFTLFILYSIPLVVYIVDNYTRNYVVLSYSIISSLVYYVIFLANIINHPVERLIYHKFEHQAKSKLKSMEPNLKVIGITGSYGKTSSKNILNDILNIKYNSLATPKSLNTFNGLMITVNNQLSKFDDVFIAEMGAYVKGEINGLCKLVNPKYGIITSIGTAHLETFVSEKNIQ